MAKKAIVENDPGRAYLEIRALASGFFAALVKNGYLDEAQDFAEWFSDTFGEEEMWDSALST